MKNPRETGVEPIWVVKFSISQVVLWLPSRQKASWGFQSGVLDCHFRYQRGFVIPNAVARYRFVSRSVQWSFEKKCWTPLKLKPEKRCWKKKTPQAVSKNVETKLQALIIMLSIEIAGWWFGTCFFHILGIVIPTDFHTFQRSWNHQPV